MTSPFPVASILNLIASAANASISFRKTGNLRIIQVLLDHMKVESTVRYLSVDFVDALELVEASRERYLIKPMAASRPILALR